jgi:hypothetical protein
MEDVSRRKFKRRLHMLPKSNMPLQGSLHPTHAKQTISTLDLQHWIL